MKNVGMKSWLTGLFCLLVSCSAFAQFDEHTYLEGLFKTYKQDGPSAFIKSVFANATLISPSEIHMVNEKFSNAMTQFGMFESYNILKTINYSERTKEVFLIVDNAEGAIFIDMELHLKNDGTINVLRFYFNTTPRKSLPPFVLKDLSTNVA